MMYAPSQLLSQTYATMYPTKRGVEEEWENFLRKVLFSFRYVKVFRIYVFHLALLPTVTLYPFMILHFADANALETKTLEQNVANYF